MANSYEVQAFHRKVQTAMERVKKVLHITKVPQLAADVHHHYEDKYLLTERMVDAAASSQLNCLAEIGLAAESIQQLRERARTATISLEFRAERHCTFLREATREVDSSSKSVREVSEANRPTLAFTSKVVTTVTEYFWKLESTYTIIAVCGAGGEPENQMVLTRRTGSDELVTTGKTSPYPAAQKPAAAFEMNVSWLFRQLADSASTPRFKIDRQRRDCHTPRHNQDVAAALKHFGGFATWARQVAGYLETLQDMDPNPSQRRFHSSETSAFVPVMPILNERVEGAVEDASGVQVAGADQQLAISDVNELLEDERRSLASMLGDTRAIFPAGDALATAAEATLAKVLGHSSAVCVQLAAALDYIESMLRQQLISAIGKEVMPADFAEYMRFHNRKLFAEPFAPMPFCFSVRRSDKHSPEGTVSIEEQCVGGGGASNISSPILTLVARSRRPRPMQFQLSASTSVRFGGDTYLHGHLSHQFSGGSGAQLSLVSRARQFSSFIVLIGRIASAHVFEPQYATIIQNRDELSVPLDMSTIPTPKEFKDAIQSLSPEQQKFAKAFRSMQLESTLFGVLVIQIKPQMEKVLNLPPDSLTKEIKLTQDLMKLFVEYQIPSDLFCFDGYDSATGTEIVGPSAAEALEAVRGHVKAMNKMIGQAKEEEIQQRRQEESYANPFLSMPYHGADDSSSSPRSRGSLVSFGSQERRKRCVDVVFDDFGGEAMECAMDCVMECEEEQPRSRKVKKKEKEGRSSSQRQVQCPPPAAAAASACQAAHPAQQQQQRQQQQQQQQPMQPVQHQQQPMQQSAQNPETQPQVPEESSLVAHVEMRDYTQVPNEMDELFEELDTDGAVRPTVITPGEQWLKKAQKSLLAQPTSNLIGSEEQKGEKDAAFDLLDALTKSGALQVDCASLHVVVASTHCFDKSLTETVIQDNANPIEKVERSMLIMASTVHQQPASAMVRDSQRSRVTALSPALFLDSGGAA